MKIKSPLAVLPLALLSSIILFLSFGYKKKIDVKGAWSVVEVVTIKPNGTSSFVTPKESLVIFDKKHYSFCWTSNNSNLQSWAISDSLKLDRFNQSIVNTGTFEIKDDVLTTNAIFAMHPMFSEGKATFKLSTRGDTLILQGVNVFSFNNVAHPVYANGSYFVSKLLKI